MTSLCSPSRVFSSEMGLASFLLHGCPFCCLCRLYSCCFTGLSWSFCCLLYFVFSFFLVYSEFFSQSYFCWLFFLLLCCPFPSLPRPVQFVSAFVGIFCFSFGYLVLHVFAATWHCFSALSPGFHFARMCPSH